jgi:uncharacterized Zn-binding protein involved in type VI secretion
MIWATIAFLAGAMGTPTVRAQVVADEACPKYSVDIAAFATCDGDHVASRDAVGLKGSPQATAEQRPTLKSQTMPRRQTGDSVRAPAGPRPAGQGAVTVARASSHVERPVAAAQ